jgi:hypothetical protein
MAIKRAVRKLGGKRISMEYETKITLGRNDKEYTVTFDFGFDKVDGTIDLYGVYIDCDGKELKGNRYKVIEKYIDYDKFEEKVKEAYG